MTTKRKKNVSRLSPAAPGGKTRSPERVPPPSLVAPVASDAATVLSVAATDSHPLTAVPSEITEPAQEVAADASSVAPPTDKPQSRWTKGRIARYTGGIVGVALVLIMAWIAFLVIRLQGRIYVELPPTPTARAVAEVLTPTRVTVSSATREPTAVVEPTPDRIKELPVGRINVLVLGTDKRENDPDHYPRSDTLLLANVDTISRTVRIMSIPRDLIVDIPDYGKSKVNAAYLFGEYYKEPGGGQALAVRTISQLFNVPIQYYIAVNFAGFRKVVDTVGGITVDVPYSIDDLNYPSDDEGDPNGEIHVHFDEGIQQMDGKTALRYARTRHADNDFARSRRQLQVILAVRQKALSLNLIPALPSLIEDLGGMVQTNIPFDQQLGFIQLGYNLGASSIITSSIDATMITPDILPDGSEGLKLNKKVAQQMLDAFFGWDVASSGSDSSGESNSAPTPKPTTKARATVAPTKRPARSSSP